MGVEDVGRKVVVGSKDGGEVEDGVEKDGVVRDVGEVTPLLMLVRVMMRPRSMLLLRSWKWWAKIHPNGHVWTSGIFLRAGEMDVVVITDYKFFFMRVHMLLVPGCKLRPSRVVWKWLYPPGVVWSL